MMFDLNLSVDCNGKVDHSELHQSPATSISSVVDGGGETSSSNDDAYSARVAPPSPVAVTLNFDIVGGSGENDRDRGLTPAELVTRQLFPVSRLGEMNLGKQISDSVSLHGSTRMSVQPQQVQQVQARKSRRGPRSRSSQYRGVTFYRRTGRWESHIWDCGKQVYLGGFDTDLAAARAYDRAALKFRGVDADINFNISDYDEDMKQTTNLSKEEFVHILRRQSTGFSRGSSKYRGVTLHKCGRWEARMGQFLGKKAYDKAAIKCSGREAVTNFESSSYKGEMGSSNDLDLNLGMSSSSPRESGNSGSFQFHPYDVQTASMFKLHVEGSSAMPLKGLPLASQLPILSNPNFSPNSGERAAQERAGLASSQEVVNWGWQMHDQVHSTPVTTLCTAASSGFSSRPMALNLCFSSYPTTSTNVPQFHSQISSLSPPPRR